MNKKNHYLSFFLILIVVLLLSFPIVRGNIKKIFISVTSSSSTRLSSGGAGIRNFFGSISNISSLRKQNNELADKISQLEVDRSKISELQHENDLLKQELGFAQKNQELSLLPAIIIGREPTSFLDHVIIDKGKLDGVEKGMGAIFSGALVGQVSDVYENQAKIILVTSKDSIIQAMLSNSRSKGLLRGGISGLVLQNIVQDINFETGEYVVTSGLDGQLKPGILVGKTTHVESSTSDLFKNIGVEPIADLSRLELVFIIK